MSRTKVFIVDDSALMRQLLTEIIANEPDLEVVGAAGDPYAAWEKMRKVMPDVLTLDVEMPRMDGITFLEKLMRAHPMPVVMISSLTEQGCRTTLRALELGAVDFVTKPKVDMRDGTVELGDEIVFKIRAAAGARVRSRRPSASARPTQPAAPVRSSSAMAESTHRIIAIGASTGGTQAIEEVLVPLPADAPGIVIVQHMPANFTKSFAERLDERCRIKVSEARDGDRVLPGHALIAPGNYHMRLTGSGASYLVNVDQSPPVNRHRPSVDVLFHSCAQCLGSNGVGVILTGMGIDGADGLLAMQRAGARTIAQDEESCVVFGMPRAAIVAGAVDEVQSIEVIAEASLRWTAATC